MQVWHYLYFPDDGVATAVAGRLRAAGYDVEIRQSPPQWLVRPRHTAADQAALDRASDELEQIAASESGEYDGWERQVAAAERSLRVAADLGLPSTSGPDA